MRLWKGPLILPHSFQLCMVMACAILSGKAFDAGYVKHLLVGGTVLYTAGCVGRPRPHFQVPQRHPTDSNNQLELGCLDSRTPRLTRTFSSHKVWRVACVQSSVRNVVPSHSHSNPLGRLWCHLPPRRLLHLPPLLDPARHRPRSPRLRQFGWRRCVPDPPQQALQQP